MSQPIADILTKKRSSQLVAPKKWLGGRIVAYALFTLAGAAITSTVFLARGEGFSRKQPAPPATASRPAPSSYYDLLAMPPAELEKVDLAVVNLLCAKGLPGTENLDIPAILARLDEWAAKVKAETQRHLYRVTDPRYADHYAHSEARLRAEFLVQSL